MTLGFPFSAGRADRASVVAQVPGAGAILRVQRVAELPGHLRSSDRISRATSGLSSKSMLYFMKSTYVLVHIYIYIYVHIIYIYIYLCIYS